MNDRDIEPPKGGWGLLLILIIAFWAMVFFLFRVFTRGD